MIFVQPQLYVGVGARHEGGVMDIDNGPGLQVTGVQLDALFGGQHLGVEFFIIAFNRKFHLSSRMDHLAVFSRDGEIKLQPVAFADGGNRCCRSDLGAGTEVPQPDYPVVRGQDFSFADLYLQQFDIILNGVDLQPRLIVFLLADTVNLQQFGLPGKRLPGYLELGLCLFQLRLQLPVKNLYQQGSFFNKLALRQV